MTQETYKGLCIGGPKAGEMLEGESPTLCIHRMYDLPDLADLRDDKSTTFADPVDVYVFVDGFAVISEIETINAWFHESIKTRGDAIKAVLSYYAAGKHPQEDT